MKYTIVKREKRGTNIMNELLSKFTDGLTTVLGLGLGWLVGILIILGGVYLAYRHFIANPIDRVTGAPRRAIKGALGIPGKLGSRLKFRRKKAEKQITAEPEVKTDSFQNVDSDVTTEPGEYEVPQEEVATTEKTSRFASLRSKLRRPRWGKNKEE